MEDLAVAKSSVAISSAHHFDDDHDDHDDHDDINDDHDDDHDETGMMMLVKSWQMMFGLDVVQIFFLVQKSIIDTKVQKELNHQTTILLSSGGKQN